QSEPQMEQSEPQIGQQSISEGDAQNMGSEYIFSDTDVRYLTREEVEKLSLQAACYAKNEIYARHGRMFRSQELQDYFGEKSWYVGSIPPDEFSETVFNDYEKANISSLQSWEYTLNGNGYLLDQAGYDIHSF
ncbi:MAG: YARHG domain-containing protein, partial [Lachnospiraceae bacterium]|nr:YARHG domain-containing protein [Lachnospiraceae bacterium]